MSSDREVGWLRDIVEFSTMAIGYVDGNDLESFVRDQKTSLAVERLIEKLAEAAIRIGAARFAELTAGLPLAPVKGMGNALRHAYDRIDLGTVYETVVKDLPPLRDACAAALRRFDPDA